tara:strand:- start:5322 stop:5942 length:621 start_codon:yes stop_codon:yes gene_type:complete
MIGEFKSVRGHNNHAAIIEDECRNVGSIGEIGQAKPASAAAISAGINGDAKSLPPAVTAAEMFEERLGMAMLREALHDPCIPNPPKWAKARLLATARRAQLAVERRARVKMYAEDGEMTAPEVARILGCAETTIRVDLQVLRMMLPSRGAEVTDYQRLISERRERIDVLAKTGMTRKAASDELNVSEATIRRDVKIMKIAWEGDVR